MAALSPSDILKGLQICKWIYDNYFDRVNRADVRYLQFGRDVQNLDLSLKRLEREFPPTSTAQEYRHDLLNNDLAKQEAAGLLGDFNRTLGECESVLKNNTGLVKSGSGFIESVTWAVSTEKVVDELRAKIHLHIDKIQLFLSTVHLERHNILQGDVSEILAHVSHMSGLDPPPALAPIPAWLHVRFTQALAYNRPSSYRNIEDFPVDHGFEALHRFFMRSTGVGSQPGDGSMEQYLDLLKAHWILVTMMRSNTFQSLRPGSYYRRSTEQMQRKIAHEYARRDGQIFSQEDLQKLDQGAFLIWPVPQTMGPRQLMEPTEFEEKILEISLRVPESFNAPTQDLVVFRQSSTVLRIARNVAVPDGNVQIASEQVNTETDSFVPLYAVPTASDAKPPLTIKIRNGKSAGGSLYELKSITDAFQLQRAFTGYKVLSDIVDVGWSIKKPSWLLAKFSKNLNTTQRIQIWGWDPLSAYLAPPSLVESRERHDSGAGVYNSSECSQLSDETSKTAAKVLMGEDQSRFSAAKSRRNGVAFTVRTSPNPVLVIFIDTEEGYGFIQVEMFDGITIAPSSCGCSKSPESCRRAVIECEPSGSFEVRQLAVRHAQLDYWDVSAIGVGNAKGIERMKCNYLNLDFRRVEDRKKFNLHFRAALEIRDEAAESYHRTLKKAEHFRDRPSNNHPSSKTARRRSSSMWSASFGGPRMSGALGP